MQTDGALNLKAHPPISLKILGTMKKWLLSMYVSEYLKWTKSCFKYGGEWMQMHLKTKSSQWKCPLEWSGTDDETMMSAIRTPQNKSAKKLLTVKRSQRTVI